MRALILPPLPLYLLMAVGLLIARKRRRLGLSIAAGALGALILLSLPVVSALLLTSLQTEPALELRPRALPTAEAIVVLGADQEADAPEYGGPTVGELTLERLRYAARLARFTSKPVLVSAGRQQRREQSLASLMAGVLREDLGVEVRWVEGGSANTFANARETSALLANEGIQRVYLVTHAWHMPRARASFRHHGIEVVCAPMGFRVVPRPDPGDFVPSSKGLRESVLGLHEWIGLLWYELRLF